MTIFLYLISLVLHDFHVSKCLVEYNEKTNSIEISIHLFIDDFEDGLKGIGSGNLFLCTEKEDQQSKEWIEKYLNAKFRIELDGKPVMYEYLGKETANDLMAFWCYMEIPNVETFSTLAIHNDLLTEIFSDQKNIVSVIGPQGKKELFLFQKGSGKQTLRIR
jgi:hypothetical protein